MSALLETFFSMVERGPLGMWAFLAGLAVSWGVMLRLRTWHCPRLSVHARQFLSHTLAFGLSIAATWAVWPHRYGFVVGVVVALFGPWSWEAMLLAIEWKWPKLAGKLRSPL